MDLAKLSSKSGPENISKWLSRPETYKKKEIIVLVNEFDQPSDFLQTPPSTESKSRRMLSKSLGLSIKRYDMCKMSRCQWIWMNLTRVLPCEYSHFSCPRRPLRTFCGSSSSNNKKKNTESRKRTPATKKHLIYVRQHVNCFCLCKRSFLT